MQAVSDLFDQWRSTRKKNDRIAEGLWEAAADLSPSYSTCQSSKALRLDLKELKRANSGVEGFHGKPLDGGRELQVEGRTLTELRGGGRLTGSIRAGGN